MKKDQEKPAALTSQQEHFVIVGAGLCDLCARVREHERTMAWLFALPCGCLEE